MNASTVVLDAKTLTKARTLRQRVIDHQAPVHEAELEHLAALAAHNLGGWGEESWTWCVERGPKASQEDGLPAPEPPQELPPLKRHEALPMVWRLTGWLAQGLGLEEGHELAIAQAPLKRAPSAWDHRATRTLERDDTQALERLRDELEAEQGGLLQLGLHASAQTLQSSIDACTRALERRAADAASRAAAQRRARDYARRAQQMGPQRLPEDWPTLCKALPLEDVLSQLGASPGRSGWSCPACGAERRGKHDHRAPVYVDRSKRSYTCWACKFSGDQVDLAQAALGLELIPAARWLLGAS